MYDELVKDLREKAGAFDYDGRPGIACDYEQAADAIDELQKKLCDWCGVCPEERRRPSECEIIYPNMTVPEVSIIPAEEGET